MAENIPERVTAVVAKISGISAERIEPTTTFEEMELDSLSRIEVLVDLEREFGIETQEDRDEQIVASILTVQDAIRFVEDWDTSVVSPEN
jgi:acyl carrier protein